MSDDKVPDGSEARAQFGLEEKIQNQQEPDADHDPMLTKMDGQAVPGEVAELERALEPEEVPEGERSSDAFKERLDPGQQHIANPLPPEDLLAMVGAQKKNRWLAIFIQLSRCERFLKFVEMNYVI